VTVRDYRELLRRRWLMVALITIIGGGAALALSLSTTPEYASSVSLFVSASQSPTDVGSIIAAEQLTQQRVTSYADLADSRDIASAVINQLGPARVAQVAGVRSASAPRCPPTPS